MLFNIWRFIQLLLPYGLILYMYRKNQALPANIRTRQGNNYKAMLITEDYGILFSEDKYIKNRSAYLMQQKKLLEQQSNIVINELNNLDFAERERAYNEAKELANQQSVKDNNEPV